MHKAVILDLGKTVIHFDFERGYRALERLCPHAASDMPERIRASHLVERFESGQIEPRAFHEELCRTLDLRVDYESFCEIWNSIFTDPLIPERLLEGLAARYRLLLLSNTNAIHFDGLRRNYPLLRHFHDTILSYEVGAMKPNPRIYQAAIERAGCRPQECFYTDDIPAFVDAARAAGMDAAPFVGLEQFERDLSARGIRWNENHE
jgi:putative hydrolase of the HAD superfamily